MPNRLIFGGTSRMVKLIAFPQLNLSGVNHQNLIAMESTTLTFPNRQGNS